ncbi:TonB-dependent receptor [Stenotrophomonas sp. PS02289]|uniref:TonB-dependent receptor n=1 Tax=Stenotrophomonas sp. PS02289 TaxID=2991422 RepID=UPI00249B56EA|nr:TonB-dependent receptor [Stenotrophomonas sp. PS02289]
MLHDRRRASLRSLRRTALHGALLHVLCAAAMPLAYAQDTDAPATPAQATTLDQVQVTGTRGTIQTSIDRKREETVVSDVLSADDIGDLPALSIGEAIETITGASTHREKGGASEISIRGLGPFLGSSTFNGREATNGSGDRSVNFNQFPSELINTVAIYKTQRADFVEGGVAGTVNMETVKPLEYGKRTIQLDGRGTWQEYDDRLKDGDGMGWRGTASYIDQFDMGAAGTLGVSLGLQALEGSNPEEMLSSSSTWVACDGREVVGATRNCTQVNGQQVADGVPYYLVPSSRIYRQFIEHDQRDSQFGALQWRPNGAWEVNLDYQHSKRDYTEDRSDLSLSSMMRNLNNRVVTDDGALLHHTGSTTVDSTGNFLERMEEYTGGGFNVIFRPNPAWTLSTDLSYSNTQRDQIERSTRLRAGRTDVNGNPVPGIKNTRYVDYTYDYHGDVPSIYLDPAFDVNNADNFTDSALIRRRQQSREHTIRAQRFDVTFAPEAGFFTALKGGLRRSEATYADFDDTRDITTTDVAAIRAANRACRQAFPQDDFLDNASGNTIDQWASFDSRCLFKAFTGVDDTGLSADLRDPANNDVTEKTYAAYFMGEFSSEWFGLPVTGNLGLRWVRTDVRSVGLRSGLDVTQNPDGTVTLRPTGEFTSQTLSSSNDQWLPSLNAAFELRPDLLLRVGAYRAMSRPDLAAEGYGRSFNLDDVDTEFGSVADALGSITATGNPRAKPLMSWNADVSLEWYANADSILSTAVYYKQFNGGSMPVVVDETFEIDGESVSVPVEQLATSNQKSDLFGFELTGSHTFSYLPGIFSGLGVKASYNYADSNFRTEDLRLGESTDPVTGVVTPRIVEPANIFGLSRHVASAQVYWGLGKLDLQAIYKYRSDYYQQFVGDPSQNRYVRDNGSLDFRATYKVNKHLSFSLSASNLTDEPRVSDMPILGSFREYTTYGRRYYLGVRYRF